MSNDTMAWVSCMFFAGLCLFISLFVEDKQSEDQWITRSLIFIAAAFVITAIIK